MAKPNHSLFRQAFKVGDAVDLVANASGKGLGPRTIHKISPEEVVFTLPDGRVSHGTLLGVTIDTLVDGIVIRDLKGRILAHYCTT